MEELSKKQEKGVMQWLAEFAAPFKGKFTLSVVLAVLGVACGMLPYFAAAQIVILLLSKSATMALCIPWCVMIVAGYAGKTVFANISTSLSHTATFGVLKVVRTRLSEKLTRVPMGYLLDTPSGKLKDVLVEKVESLETTLAHLLPEMTSNILIPLGIIIYLFVLDWRMALVSLITLPVGFVCYMGMMRGYAEKWKGFMGARNHMQSTTVEYINGIEVIKTFNQSAGSYGKYTDAVQNSAATVIRWMKETELYSGLGLAIWPSVLAAVLPIGAAFVIAGSLSETLYITVMILALGIVGPVIAALSFTDNMSQVGTTIGEIAAVLNQPDLIRPDAEKKISGTDIEAKNISFAYNDKTVLHDVSFRIKSGTVNALVGPSGGGKSTIARLLAGFWDTASGDILLGGVRQKDIPLWQWNRMIAYVSQDNYLFDANVMENIRMGKAGAPDDEVISAAKACGCHEFIMKLENGYQTIAGGAGGHLSGGERQRIAIARAMLKDAPIIIFDEATAYTDPENEALVQSAVARLIKGKTLLVIAHRLSTITDADNIMLIENGRLTARGTHGSLLDSSKVYSGMWKAHIGARDEALNGGNGHV